jgi:preprotein translocase subunit SecF
MIDIVGRRAWYFAASGLLLVVSIVALAVFGLKAGIDFSSGSITTLSFNAAASAEDVEDELAALDFSGNVEDAEGGLAVRTIRLSDSDKARLIDGLVARFGEAEELGFENVDPVIAEESARIAGIAVGLSAIGILIYITWAFRRMPQPFRYGLCAVIALIHDVVLVLGVFAILGAILNWEITLMFITGILAVIGYSVNNTVVVFDRIRENVRRGISPDFSVVVNSSLVDTLGRSLNTSLTTLAVLLALIFFVGVSIQNFAVVLLIGVIAGTYSSLFVAPQLLVVWAGAGWRGVLGNPSLSRG